MLCLRVSVVPDLFLRAAKMAVPLCQPTATSTRKNCSVIPRGFVLTTFFIKYVQVNIYKTETEQSVVERVWEAGEKESSHLKNISH